MSNVLSRQQGSAMPIRIPGEFGDTRHVGHVPHGIPTDALEQSEASTERCSRIRQEFGA
ncbi:MAG TPA: hypothetical protein DDX19_12390 [Rhodopirellula baltica]|uniref:hypothetical protein n=1 Tax=Rhodopirellula baltica TaxID=265606 RepID=UPI000E91BBD1|nr:hypothetical protein [Rhodopirellula baltica]